MSISPDGMAVRFKTESESLFLAEKVGVKPNTAHTHTPPRTIGDEDQTHGVDDGII